MKVAIVSFAHMHAYSYANALKKHPNLQFVGIYDNDVTRGEKAASYFNVPLYKDYSNLLNSGVDSVIIASENSMHYEHVIQAANAQKHILCEKPLGVSMKEMEEMIDVCKQKEVILQTAFPVRFHPAVQRAKAVIDSGEIGDILAIKGTNRGTNPGGWFNDRDLSGGGAVIDHTVHVVDLIRWMTGQEVITVYAEVDSLFTSGKIDDSGILTMDFNNGLFATLDCSWSRNEFYPVWGDVTLEIIGSKGNIHVDAFSQNLTIHSNKKGTKWVYWGDDADFELVQDFYNNVKAGKNQSITGEDGLKAVEVALAAYKSSQTNEPKNLSF